MKFIEEIVEEEFVPTFRSMLAEELSDRGLTQHEVASLLGISQSAVSKYVHGDVERNDRLLDSARLRAHVDSVADGLVAGDVTSVQMLIETEVLIRDLERGGVLAEMHSEAVPELTDVDTDFAIHDPDSRLLESERVRSSVRRGLRMLENASGFPVLIPAVGSNLVECLPEASGVEDVVAVPGRILDVKGRVTVPAEPEFGVSQHVATVLLAARRSNHAIRATVNVGYDADILSRLEEGGHETAVFDAEADLEAGIGEALESNPAADVVYQTGTVGVEPIVYILGPDAPTVAEVVRDLA